MYIRKIVNSTNIERKEKMSLQHQTSIEKDDIDINIEQLAKQHSSNIAIFKQSLSKTTTMFITDQ